MIVGLPNSDEIPPEFASYIELAWDPDLVSVLVDQRRPYLDFLHALPAEHLEHRYAPGKWSMKEVIGHVNDTERIFTYRALAFARGERGHLPGFDEAHYVPMADFDKRSLSSLTQEFDLIRQGSLALFESLDEASWLRTGTAEHRRFSVRSLGYFIAGHLVHHRRIIEQRYLPKSPRSPEGDQR